MKDQEHTSCIRLVPIFNHLDKESQKIIASKAYSKKLKRNDFLYQEGDVDNSLYIVHQGQIRITHLAESGKEQVIRILNPGEFTGEWTVFSDAGYHDHYAQATRPTNICTIRREDVEELLQQYPDISTALLKTMANRLQKSQKQTASIATEEVTNRLIYYLEDLALLNGEDNTTIHIPMTRKDLASYLGTTPETISRRFKELEEKELIHPLPKSKIHIPSVKDLLSDAR